MNLRLIASGKVLPFTVVQEVRKLVTEAVRREIRLSGGKARGGFLNPQGIKEENRSWD